MAFTKSHFPDRRSFLKGSATILACGMAGAAAGRGLGAPDLELRATSGNSFGLLPGAPPTLEMMKYGDKGPPPVIRLKQNRPFTVDLVNQLGEPSTIHWHGLRIPNREDGVPYLTQNPVASGETHRYTILSPDAGTFWYHPHCNTLSQMSRGLNGALIVEEENTPDPDADIPLLIRDFRLGKDGQFIKFLEPGKAARGGTPGTVTTTNWAVNPLMDVPAGGLVRLRFIVSDVTRIYAFSLGNNNTKIIALDGQPTTLPIRFQDIRIAPGQRADVLLRTPDQEGIIVNAWRAGLNGPVPIARFRTIGTSLNRNQADFSVLPPNPVSVPDTSRAEIISFKFGWSPDGDAPETGICGTLGYTFWSINKKPWPGDIPSPISPLATLRIGRSYIFRLQNETPNAHPIHLHGMIFRLLRSNRRKVLPLWTDTTLLLANETMDIALVADNPGDWVFHCHVIEHQKTGLTGFIRVDD